MSFLSDILSAVDRADFAALVLIDLAAAFDTVDPDILLQRLQTSFGIVGAALKWFQSYLTIRTQYVLTQSTTDMWCSTGLSARAYLGNHVHVYS